MIWLPSIPSCSVTASKPSPICIFWQGYQNSEPFFFGKQHQHSPWIHLKLLQHDTSMIPAFYQSLSSAGVPFIKEKSSLPHWKGGLKRAGWRINTLDSWPHLTKDNLDNPSLNYSFLFCLAAEDSTFSLGACSRQPQCVPQFPFIICS